MSPRVLILRAPGTNCDEESAHAFALAGGAPERWHVNRLLESPQKAAEFQILCLPGGFSYGDDIAAGRILGNQIEHHLADTLQEFRDAGKLIIGICNGFQILLKTELLLAHDASGPVATLAANDSGKFEDRWVRLAVASTKDGVNPCVFLSGIDQMELPVAHGEGRFVPRDEQRARFAASIGTACAEVRANCGLRIAECGFEFSIRTPKSEFRNRPLHPLPRQS